MTLADTYNDDAVLDHYRARQIAAEWHSGQRSPLYAFASTGTILPTLADEIGECLATVTAGSPAWADLTDLAAFVGAA